MDSLTVETGKEWLSKRRLKSRSLDWDVRCRGYILISESFFNALQHEVQRFLEACMNYLLRPLSLNQLRVLASCLDFQLSLITPTIQLKKETQRLHAPLRMLDRGGDAGDVLISMVGGGFGMLLLSSDSAMRLCVNMMGTATEEVARGL